MFPYSRNYALLVSSLDTWSVSHQEYVLWRLRKCTSEGLSDNSFEVEHCWAGRTAHQESKPILETFTRKRDLARRLNSGFALRL